MKRFFKWAGILLLALIVIGGLSFYVWSQQTYSATSSLKEKVDLQKAEAKDGKWLVFEGEGDKGVILYPGAKVEKEAYAYIGQELSERGYTVVIPDVPLNLAFFGVNVPDEIMKEYKGVKEWYLSGHSLGGVAASSYAADHPDKVQGIIYLASYPAESTDFSSSDLSFLSIWAENDGLATKEKIDKSKSLLPADTEFHEVKGGNHAGFGVYGAQKGDGKATKSVWNQQDEVIKTIDEWIQGRAG